MPMLPLRAPRVLSGFARVGAALVTVLDVIAEAQMQALAAHKKLYPFEER
jgi:hypothetical protein